jgi:hypothetical protein
MNKRFEEQLKRDPWLREMYAKLPPRKPRPKTAVVWPAPGLVDTRLS